MYELHFNQRGELLDGSALPLLQDASRVLVLAHGWNSSVAEARDLYCGLLKQLSQFGEEPAAIAVFWPSKKFDDDLGKEFDSALDSPMARQILVGAMRAAVPRLDPLPEFHGLPVEILLRRLAGATTMRHGLLNLGNLTTFYQMKERAGAVGGNGVAPVLDALRARHPGLQVHLAGHSFGARLVTAAADSVKTPVRSMTLLQGAFSHHAFSPSVGGGSGAFREVLTHKQVAGPILATHTRNDKAVGLAYALAARAAGQEAAFLGDASDRFGGIGSNGARKTPEALDQSLLPAGRPYLLEPGKIHNLRADPFISGHSDIVRPEIGWLLSQALAA
ncbi:MAG: hypothetical protein ABI823_03260 [Bryobacteraceae bacterium]